MKKLALLLIVFSSFSLIAQEERRNYVEYHVNVSPNPSDGPIKIEAPNGATCKVISFRGDYIGSWKVENEQLKIEGLKPGKYIALIQYMGTETQKKIVIL